MSGWPFNDVDEYRASNQVLVELTRAGAHYQLGRSDRDQFVQRNLIIAVNRHVGSFKDLDVSQTELKSTF